MVSEPKIGVPNWMIDIGHGAGEEGGRIVACGTPQEVAKVKESKTAVYLRRTLKGE